MVFFQIRKPNKHQNNNHQRKSDYVISVNAEVIYISHGVN